MTISPRSTVAQLKPYPKPLEGRQGFARLDLNENTSGFPDAYPAGMPDFFISAYPEYGTLITRLADYYKIDANSIMLTNGSDEALCVVSQTFIEPGDYAIVSSPCFAVIPHSLRLAGANLREVPVLPDLTFNLAGIEAALEQGARMAVFATPDNPTGALLDADCVNAWCQRFPQTLFVIDEAYGEFVDSSLLANVSSQPNLLVLKTFSKAWGMAGLRLGVTVAAPQLIEWMDVVKLPYSVNSAAVWTALRLLDRSAEVKQKTTQALATKKQLVSELEQNGYRVTAGNANSFLLGAGINAERLSDYCRSQGVLIRNRSNAVFPADLNGSRPPLWGRVRVSIGTDRENKQFLSALKTFDKRYGVIFDLDGTLVDTSQSFDATVSELVLQYTGKPLPPEELQALRAEGGFNDDWVAARELIARRGVEVGLVEVSAKAIPLYLQLGRKYESLLISLDLLQRLRSRYPVFIVTGRRRFEYEPVWGNQFNDLFSRVYCLGDLADKQGKPAPDYLLQVIDDYQLVGGVYIGNAVDDMQAARAAGLDAIGFTESQTPQRLREAGAQLTMNSLDELAEVFML